jgi:hypothetical protein
MTPKIQAAAAIESANGSRAWAPADRTSERRRQREEREDDPAGEREREGPRQRALDVRGEVPWDHPPEVEEHRVHEHSERDGRHRVAVPGGPTDDHSPHVAGRMVDGSVATKPPTTPPQRSMARVAPIATSPANNDASRAFTRAV